MSFRAFISVDLNVGQALRDVCDELRGTKASLKVVNPSIMHITLKFLGDIDEAKVPDIARIIRSSAEGVEPFQFKLNGMGAFPNRNRIKVVWVGIPNPGAMVILADRLDEGLASLGFERERREFKPHLTVARARGPKGMDDVQDIMRRRGNQDFGSQSVDSIRLKKSVLGPKGPTYHTVEEIPLEG